MKKTKVYLSAVFLGKGFHLRCVGSSGCQEGYCFSRNLEAVMFMIGEVRAELVVPLICCEHESLLFEVLL